MLTESYKILEFYKLKNIILENITIEENRNKLLELSPMRDMSLLNREFSIVQDFTDLLLFDGGFETSGLKDICKFTEKIKLIGTFLEPEELWHINYNLRVFRVFKSRLEELGKYKHLKSVFSSVEPLRSLEDIINRSIDITFEIKDDASLDLRDLRVHKKTISQNIKRKFEELFEEPSISKAFQDTIVTERDGRMVVPVKTDFKGLIKGIEHDRSSSGQTVFIEPLSIVSLNNKMRELDIREKDEIRKILMKITEFIRNNREPIDKIGESILYLDILNAKCMYGINNNCIIPNINGKELLILDRARHPLIPKESVVSLSFEVGKSYNILLITGPNTGGKTVALKTAGLLTLMALSGIPIPAEKNSSIAFFDGVFADIGDEQSIEQSLSSFSGHVKNIKYITENLTKNSLVLLDELGSGTDPGEGSAFAMAIIDYLKTKNVKSIITTHYSDVKAYGYNEDGIETASMEFNIETLSPTYKLLMGIPGESNALNVAKKIGISDEILEKAKSYVGEDNKKVETMINKIKTQSEELDFMKARFEILQAEVKYSKEEYQEKLDKLAKDKDEILKNAYDDAEKMINEMRSKASALVEKIQTEDMKKEDAKKLQKSLNMITSALKEEKTEKLQKTKKIPIKVNFKVGDKVFVTSINQFATVLKINISKETASVQAGILKLEAKLDDLKIVQEKKKIEYNVNMSKKISVRNEIDLRGKMVDEALFELEVYLDRAVVNSFNEVFIIHGKGTGALRAGVLNYLKESRYVKDFRISNQGEGGLGCTVVNLK